MENVAYVMMQNRQRLYIKIYAVLCAILAISIGFYLFNKWGQYSGYRQIVSANDTYLEELKAELADEKASYEEERGGFNALQEEVGEKLATIFPTQESYTDLTRQFDEYEDELASKNNPFEIRTIEYQSSVRSDFYSILPLRMNIDSSADNFRKFLHLVENSGTLTDQVRLMDISSIRLNFQNDDEEDLSGIEIISFTVQINAYFQ